jgi:hypothetical protein
MKLPKRIFVTGAPGSRWSGIIQKIEEHHTQMDISVYRDNQRFDPVFRGGIVRGFHRGIYFEHGTEYEPILDAEYLDKPWGDSDKCRFVRSHHWAYHLEEIREKFPDDWILMVYRPDEMCLAWWMEVGGFHITHPDYSYYKDVPTMSSHIKQMNLAMLKFGHDVNASWNYYTLPWIIENFGEDITVAKGFDRICGPGKERNDILVSLIK